MLERKAFFEGHAQAGAASRWNCNFYNSGGRNGCKIDKNL